MGKFVSNLKVAWPTFLAIALASSLASYHHYAPEEKSYFPEEIPKTNVHIIDYHSEDTSEIEKEIDRIVQERMIEESQLAEEQQTGFSK